MTIVVMEHDEAGTAPVGAALATALGWRLVRADAQDGPGTPWPAPGSKSDPGSGVRLAGLHDELRRAAERRESLVVACPPLTPAHRTNLVGTLRNVRFASVLPRQGAERAPADTPRASAVSNMPNGNLDAPAATDDAVFATVGDAGPDEIAVGIRREFGV